MIVDLTPALDGTGRARLLDLVPGRSATAFKDWLATQSQVFWDRVEVVAMDGFSGYKTAATDQLREATPVMDPFRVVALAGTKIDLCRQRIQQQTCGHRGRAGDPLYGVRRILRTRLPLLSARRKARLADVFAGEAHLAVELWRTRLPLLSARRKARLADVFAGEAHLAVELCWSFYQRMIAAYAHPDRRRGKAMMTAVIHALRSGVPDAMKELAQLGRTCGGAAPTRWPTSTSMPPTAPPKPSMAA